MRGRIQGLPNCFGYPLLSHERVKLRTSNFVRTFIASIGTKAHKNVGNSGRGRSQRVPTIFRAPVCKAHCAVIFAIAQLSCYWILFNCGPSCWNKLIELNHNWYRPNCSYKSCSKTCLNNFVIDFCRSLPCCLDLERLALNWGQTQSQRRAKVSSVPGTRLNELCDLSTGLHNHHVTYTRFGEIPNISMRMYSLS